MSPKPWLNPWKNSEKSNSELSRSVSNLSTLVNSQHRHFWRWSTHSLHTRQPGRGCWRLMSVVECFKCVVSPLGESESENKGKTPELMVKPLVLVFGYTFSYRVLKIPFTKQHIYAVPSVLSLSRGHWFPCPPQLGVSVASYEGLRLEVLLHWLATETRERLLGYSDILLLFNTNFLRFCYVLVLLWVLGI